MFSAHRLVDKGVGSRIVNKRLCLGVEFQFTASESQSHGTHVHQRAAVVAVVLVEGKLLAGSYTLQEVGALRLGVGQFVEFVHHIGDGTFEAFEHLALWPFYVGQFAFALKAFALEHYLTTVGIRIGDFPPDAHGVIVLLRRIDLHFDRELIVLA